MNENLIHCKNMTKQWPAWKRSVTLTKAMVDDKEEGGMTFDEWYTDNEPDLDLLNYPEEALQAAFKAAAEQSDGEIARLYKEIDEKSDVITAMEDRMLDYNAESIADKQRIAELEEQLKNLQKERDDIFAETASFYI